MDGPGLSETGPQRKSLQGSGFTMQTKAGWLRIAHLLEGLGHWHRPVICAFSERPTCWISPLDVISSVETRMYASARNRFCRSLRRRGEAPQEFQLRREDCFRFASRGGSDDPGNGCHGGWNRARILGAEGIGQLSGSWPYSVRCAADGYPDASNWFVHPEGGEALE
jgi:hypothetical protein